MTIRPEVLQALDKTQDVEAPLPATLEDHLAWVNIRRRFPSTNPDHPTLGHNIKPNAKYVIRWIEMSKVCCQAYLEGSDIGVNSDATHLELEYADDEAELEQLLATRLKDLNALTLRSKSPIHYPG